MKRTGLRNRQSGFTLIELVVVIVILGILAATALPRFLDLTSDAQKAAVQGVGGGLSSSVGIAHAKWLTNGTAGVPTTLAAEGGAFIYMNHLGWPMSGGNTTKDLTALKAITKYTAATSGPPATPDVYEGSAAATAQSDANTVCINIWNNLLNNGRPSIAAEPADGDLSALATDYAAKGTWDTDKVSQCTYKLVKASTKKIDYDMKTGAITITP